MSWLFFYGGWENKKEPDGLRIAGKNVILKIHTNDRTMKKGFWLLMLLFPLLAFGQTRVVDKLFLFDEFEPGRAMLKRGGSVNNSFNYDLLQQQFLFMEGGVPLTLVNADDITSIIVQDRVFVHQTDGVFYERIPLADGKFYYIRWWASMSPKGKPMGFGVTSQATGQVEVYGTVQSQGQFHSFSQLEEFDSTLKNVYYVLVDGRERQFTSVQTLGRVFRNHRDEIQEFAGRENINFSKPADVQRIMEFCAPFM